MTVLNNVSRYQLAIEALKRADRLRSEVGDLIDWFEGRLAAHRAYTIEHGEDMPDVRDWVWTSVNVPVTVSGRV